MSPSPSLSTDAAYVTDGVAPVLPSPACVSVTVDPDITADVTSLSTGELATVSETDQCLARLAAAELDAWTGSLSVTSVDVADDVAADTIDGAIPSATDRAPWPVASIGVA